MVIYVVYEKYYSDFDNGEDDAVFIECSYKNKKKAIRKARALMNEAKSNHLYIDENIINKRNPFKRNNLVDFYKEKTNKEQIMLKWHVIKYKKLNSKKNVKLYQIYWFVI